MEITIIDLIQDYGFNSVLIAIIICVLTGLIKIPIKILASKAKDSSKYTKYITFLPLILGFSITVLYEYIVMGAFCFTGKFVTLWLTSSSLSLAIYAFIDKFIPSKRKLLSEEEIKQNQEMIDEIKDYINSDINRVEIEEGEIKQVETDIVEGSNLLKKRVKVQLGMSDDNEKENVKIILGRKRND